MEGYPVITGNLMEVTVNADKQNIDGKSNGYIEEFPPQVEMMILNTRGGESGLVFKELLNEKEQKWRVDLPE